MADVPPGTVADGNVLALWVPAIADTSAPTEAELTAVGVVDLSCYLTKDGLSLGGDEQTVSDERLCSRQTFEAPGTYTDSLEVTYIFDQQSADTTDNAAYLTLRRLTEGYMVLRYGLPYETAIAADQIVDVLTVTAGVQRKQTPEANAKLKVTQMLHVTNETVRDAEVAA